MKKKYKWLSMMTGIVAGAAAVSGYVLSSKIMYIQKKDPDFIRDREVKAMRFDENWYNTCEKVELSVETPNGYTISGTLLHPLETTNTIIICHGVTENKINSIRYARMFQRLGFNSVIFDHRRHGDSGGKTTSYGHYEKYDLQALIQTVKKIIGDDAILGIHGESMGAATMILYAGTVEDNADFYISDCAFSDFSELLQIIFHGKMKFNSSLPVRLTDLFLRMRDGYWIRSVAPKEAVAKIDSPMLFIHSVPDNFTPALMSVDLYMKKRGAKELKLFEEGLHAQSFNQNPSEYEYVIRDFISKYSPTEPLSEVQL